jgi:NADPH2:quinone reductase
VAVEAAGVNFIDTYQRSGLYPGPLPGRSGAEGAGRVVAVGSAGPEGPDGLDGPTPGRGATAVPQIGDRVCWSNVSGSYAELVAVPVAAAVPVPADLGADVAAAALVQGLTALVLARRTVALGPGQTVLVHSGAGGVGLLLVQLAAAAGAAVISTVSSPAKADLVRAAGAAHVIGYDGPDGDFADQVERLVGTHALDVVYDGVGKATFDRGLGLLRPRGTFVSYGNASGAVDPVAPLRLAAAGSVYLTRPRVYDYFDTPDDLREAAATLFEEIRSGRLTVRIGREFPLAEAEQAHRALESRTTTGKLLLRP